MSSTTWETVPSLEQAFTYGPFTLSGRPFQVFLLAILPGSRGYAPLRSVPTTPVAQLARRLHATRFGLFPLRSPLLGESNSLSLPPVTKMFQFTGLASPSLCIQQGDDRVLGRPGFPIRRPPGQRLFAPLRSFSQLATSFVACPYQGIRHVPLVAFPHKALQMRCFDTSALHKCQRAARLPRKRSVCLSHAGGDGRARTGDPRLAKPVLFQLSYTPMPSKLWWA